MALKQRHKTDEMATNDTKMDWNCDSDRDKCKYNSKIPTGTWLPPQYVKWRVLKFRLGTYVPPPKRAPVVHVISMEFLHSLLRCHFARAQVTTSRNVGCFLRLAIANKTIYCKGLKQNLFPVLLPRKISVHTCNKLLNKLYVFSLQIKYCSEECRESAWEQHHRTLCLGENQGDPSHPLEQLQEAWRLLTCLCVYEITLMKHVLDRQSSSTVIYGLMHQTSNINNNKIDQCRSIVDEHWSLHYIVLIPWTRNFVPFCLSPPRCINRYHANCWG